MKNLPKLTSPRYTLITKKFLRKRSVVRIYGGSHKKTQILTITRDMTNHHLGEFAFTKKLGKSIHDSERNKKKKEEKTKITFHACTN